MRPNPTILALDTSAAHCAVALLYAGEIRASIVEPMQKGQAERLLVLATEILDQNQISWARINTIAVCTGPGNFTGVRISVSAARGLSLSLGIPAIGVSKLQALAFGTTGDISAAITAPRGQSYVQEFREALPFADPQMTQALPTSVPIFCDTASDNKSLNYIDAKTLIGNVAHHAALCADTPQPRPSPLYLRAPDAALPSDPPPTILS